MQTIPETQETQGQNIHFAGIVIRSQLHATQSIVNNLEQQTHIDVFASDEQGRIVIVIEADSERELAKTMDELSQRSGVISISLSYHEISDAKSINDIIETSQHSDDNIITKQG